MKNIRRIHTITAMALSTSCLFAESGDELKNFRFGLKATPTVNWAKPEGKIISANGAGVKIGGGLIMEFRLAKVASFQTGIQIDMSGGKIKFNNGGLNTPNANTASYYYTNADDEIATFGSRPIDSLGKYTYDKAHTHYQLNERQFKSTYITIPLSLKLKTKEIGMLTYFGQLGVNSSFRWKVKADDKLSVLDVVNSGASASKSNIDITKDASFFSAAVNFGAGVELGLSGSTALLVGLNYNLGFTNIVHKDSDYLERRANDDLGIGTLSHMPQTITSNGVVLTVGILF